MYDDTQLNEALLANTAIELKELGFEDEPQQAPPQAVKRFLARAGLTPQDLQQVGLDIADIVPMLNASWLKYLRLSQIDNTLFKLLMLPTARVWPRSKSLLFTSPGLLRQAYMTNDFIKGVQTAALPLGLSVTYTAILMDFINQVACPQGSKAETLLLFLGGSSRNNILSRLLSSRNTAYVPSLLFGLPLMWGSTKALLGALDARPLTRERAKRVIEVLQNYQPHRWQDFGRWLLPFSSLERNLNQLVRALTFDGRNSITADERYHMTIALTQLARHAQGFTQLYAIKGLAEIINGIALKDFGYLNERFASDTKAAVLFSKQQAHANLRQLADAYRLEPNQSRLKPLIRYVYANHLLWYIGQPAALSLRPLFWTVEGVKAYATFSILSALFRAMVEAIQQQVKKTQCESTGKKYSFITAIGDYACKKCPDLVAYADSHNDTSCFNTFLRHPKPVQDILMAIRRFKLTEIKTLNLAVHRLSGEELGQVLQALNAKNATFDALELYWQPSLQYSNQTIEAIKQGLPALRSKQLRLRTQMIDDLMAKAIGSSLSLETLDFTGNDLTDEGLLALNEHYPPYLRELRLSLNKFSLDKVDLSYVFQGPLESLRLIQNKVPSDNFRKLYPQLKHSNLTLFYPPMLIGEYNVTEYLEHLPWATLKYLTTLPGDYNSQATAFFTEAISYSQLTYLGIQHNQFDIDEPQQFAERIMRPSLKNLYIMYSNLQDDVFVAIAPLLNRTMALQHLAIVDVPLTSKSLIALGQNLPQSKLNVLWLNMLNVTRAGVQAVMQGAQQTPSLKELELGHNKLGDDSALAIANHLPLHLERLELGFNNITNKGIDLVANKLANSSISTLGLGFNSLGDTGTMKLANLFRGLPQLTQLELSGNDITDTGAMALAKELPHAALTRLWLDNNRITDIGSISVANALIKPACQRYINVDGSTTRLGIRQTNLTSLLMTNNLILSQGAQALCKAMTAAQIPLEELRYDSNTWQWGINISLINIRTCASAASVGMENNAAIQMITLPEKSKHATRVAPWPVTSIAILGALGLLVWYLAHQLAVWWLSKSREAAHAGLETRAWVTAEELQALGDELDDTADGVAESRQTLTTQTTIPSSVYRLGLFSHKHASAEESHSHHYAYRM